MEQITLNLIPGGIPQICNVSQYDDGRVIRLHLKNGSSDYALSGTETISLSVSKSDQTTYECTVTNTSLSYVDITTVPEMCDVSGESECELTISSGNTVLGTGNFRMIVDPDAFDGDLKVKSVSGPIATFETDLAEDLIKLDVDLEPIQDLHGYDYPWPAGGGKNIACLSVETLDNSQRITIDYLDDNNLNFTVDGTYARCMYKVKAKAGSTVTVSFKAQGVEGAYNRVNFNPQNSYSNYQPWGGFTISPDVLNTYTKTFTLDEDDFYVGFYWTASSDTGAPIVREFQIEIGSSATSFTPYENICPITGRTETKIVHNGKNLLSPNLYKGLNYNPTVGTTVTLTESPKQLTDNHDGTFSISTTANWETFCMIVPIKSTTYYRKMVISSNGALGTSEVWLDKNLKVISTYNNTDTTQTKNGLLTIPNNASYFAWVITNRAVANATLTITQPQIEVGSTATDYEPYAGTEVTVQFGQTVYKGKLYSEQRKVLVTHVGMDLGYFTWNHYVSETRNYFWSDQPPPISPKGTVSQEINDDISSIYACEKYADVVNGYTYSWIHSGFTLPSTTKRLYIYDEAMENSDAAAFKTRVTGQQFVYEVAEPFFIDLTQIQMVADPIRIPALVGTNNVYSDAGDVEVEYYTTLDDGGDGE